MPENKDQVTIHELLLSVNVTQDAMIELLDEKGLISKAEIMQRIKDMQAEIRVKKNEEMLMLKLKNSIYSIIVLIII